MIYGKRDLDWRVPRESTASIDLSQNVPYHYHLIKDIQDILVNADIHDYANDYKIYEAVCSEYNLDINRVSVGIGASDLLDRLVRILPVKKYYVVEPSYRMFEIYCQWYGKVYESIEHLIGSDERYEIEDILEEMEQKIIHDDKKTFHIGDDEEG